MVKSPRSTALYCRISQDTAGTALGVARQERDAREYCERRGWAVAAVITDNDTSAYSGKPRPGYRRLLDGLENGDYDGLVVWHPDRLHRSPAELERFIDVVEATGAVVASVTAGDFDLATPEGRLTARIVGSVSRKESEDKSRRQRRKHLEIAEKGGLSGGGKRPFGYEDDRLTVRESEAIEIRAAAARVLAGASLRSITVDWQARVPTPGGGTWKSVNVRRVLCSARVAGQRDHRGRTVTAVWPAIIDADDAIKVRAILEANRRPGQVTARSYLLSGWMHCGACGTAMRSRPAYRNGRHAKRRYACVLDKGGCGHCGITAEHTEALVTEAVLAVLDTPALTERIARREQTPEPSAGDDIGAIEARITTLAEMFSAGEISRSGWAAASASLDKRLGDARAAVAADAHDLGATVVVGDVSTLRERWPTMGLEQQRAIIGAVVDSVTIGPSTAKRFQPDRVSITWSA
ncbi:recombinase family protein [soil metagenome]